MLAATSADGRTVESLTMVFGGVRAGLVQAPLTSAAIAGKPLSLKTFEEVLPVFKKEIAIPPPPAGEEGSFESHLYIM
jgi:xanthine dehydrogenase iron-sulfur cluster and FAD-binding subunit A